MPRCQPALTRFHALHGVAPDGCWPWTGSRDGSPREPTDDPRGRYGRFALDGCKMIGAHRASWLLFRGEVPHGLHVLHSCDNPPCVNPDHLFLGTVQDNSDDKHRKGRGWQQKPGARSPRLGTGVGRSVGTLGCVVPATCTICAKAMLQRITANRQGKEPVCSQACKNALVSLRWRERYGHLHQTNRERV